MASTPYALTTTAAPPPPSALPSARSAWAPPSTRVAASGIVPEGGVGSTRRGRQSAAPPAPPRASHGAHAAPREAFGVNAIPRLRAPPALPHVDLSAEAKLQAERLRYEAGGAPSLRVRAPTLSMQGSRAVSESMAVGGGGGGGGGGGDDGLGSARSGGASTAFESRDAVVTATGIMSFPMPSAARQAGVGASQAAKQARGAATADHLVYGGAAGIVASAAAFEADRRAFEREHSAALPGRARRVRDQESEETRAAIAGVGGGGAAGGAAPPPVPTSSFGSGNVRSITHIRRHHNELYGGAEVAAVLPHREAAASGAPPVTSRARDATASSAAHDGRQSGGPAVHEPRKRTVSGSEDVVLVRARARWQARRSQRHPRRRAPRVL